MKITSLTKLNMGKAEKEKDRTAYVSIHKNAPWQSIPGREKGGRTNHYPHPPSTLIPKLLFSLNSHGSFSTSKFHYRDRSS